MSNSSILCRACMKNDCDLIPFHDDFVTTYNLLTDLNVKLLDDLPQNVCNTCFKAVQYFIEFREKCIASDTLLRTAIHEDVKNENLKEKVEISIHNSDIKQENNMLDGYLKDMNTENKCAIKEEYETLDDGDMETEYDVADDCDVSIDKSYEKILKLGNIKMTKVGETVVKRKVGRPKKIKNLSCDNGSLVIRKLGRPMKIKNENRVKKKIERPKKSTNVSKDIVAKKIKSKDINVAKKNSIPQPLLCGICPKKLENNDLLVKHLDSHGKHFNTCLICNDNFANWLQTLSHRVQHLEGIARCCHICRKRFVSSASLELHYRLVHYTEESPMLTCKHCVKKFRNPKRFQTHCKEVHFYERFTCDYCSKEFFSKRTFKTHIKAHMLRKKYKCDICDYAGNSAPNLQGHKMRKHNPKRVYCKLCSRVFPNQQVLDNHTCRGVNNRVCPVCGKALDNNKAWRSHMNKHTDVRNHKCERCPAVFKSRGALVVHNNIHDGNRTKQCEYCPAKFYYDSVLIKHRRTHTGEKPYVCRVCGKAFTGGNNLKVHMRVHGEHLVVKRVKPEDTE